MGFECFSQTSDLLISEYSEGSSNNKYIELFNGTGSDVDLSSYEVWKIANGGSWTESSLSLSGTLADGDVYVIYNSSSSGTISASGDITWGSANWNGDDAVGLAKDISGTFTLIDAVGTDGSDPGSGWSVAGTSNATKDKTIVRKPDVCSPNTNWTNSAGSNTSDSEWTVYAKDTWTYIGSHSSNCSSSSATTPAAPTIASIDNGASQVSVNFTAGSDGGAAITDYEFSIDNGSNFTSMGTTSSPYTITGLINGTNYDIQIRAVNSEGTGTASITSIGSPYLNEYSLSSFNSLVTETFNSLAISGTSNSLPAGIYLSEQDNNANSTYSTGTGTSGTGDTYSFGSNGDNDRALGGLASGSLQTSFGAKIRNETGTTLNSVVISYTGESWKIGSANRIDQLDFQYSTDATSLDDGTWTDFDNLDYVNTGQSTGSGSIQNTASISDTLTILGVANNGVFWIRWNDFNASGADDGMAVDDLSIIPICKAGTIATSASNILKGNDITWTYSGTDFFEFEYHWGDNNWSNNWGLTNNPGSWGAGQSGNQAILHVRAEATCGSESDVSNTVTTFWTDCYTEDITATVDGASITNGGDFTINSTVIWTWPTAGTGEGAGHALGYYYDSEPTDNANYNYVWSSSPTSWSNTSGSEFTSTDRLLYVKSRSSGINSCTNYASSAFSVKLKRPTITTTGTLSSFTTCEGSNSTSQSFNVSGNYISNASGITVTAPSGFEISTDDTNFSGTVNLSASSGNVASSTIYVRLSNSASSGSTSDNVICTATSAVNENIATSAIVTSSPNAGTLSGTESVCSNSSTTFSSDGDSGGAWSSASTSVATINTSSGGVIPVSAGSSVMTYTVSGSGACAGTDASATKTVTITAAATGGSLTVDKTEALSSETINWTNSGVTNGTCQYYFQWSDDNTSAPAGSWTPWDVTENQSWASSSAGSNMNRILWVKTIITASNAGCVDTETTPVFTDVKNCKAGTTTAAVSAGTVANMPFGETITYTSGTPADGSFERLQYQWPDGGGAWTNWETTSPYAYTTNANAGQNLYIRAKIVGASVNGSSTCTDYSNTIQTLLVDCPNAVSANAGNDIDMCSGSTVDFSGSGSGSTSGSSVSSFAWSPNTEISSTSSATPTISASITRTYTLTNTHDNGCTSTDDIIVTVADGPSITTSTDLTTAANTCGETELTISHSGTGGNGAWTYTGGTIAYTSGSSTDASISVRPIPADVNKDITMIWTVDAGQACDGSTATKAIRFNQPASISSPDTYCYLWGGLTSTDITTGDNWYKWNATTGVDMWERQSSAPSSSADKLHVLTTDNNCIHASTALTLGTSTLASLNVGPGGTVNLGSGTVTLNGDLTNAGTITAGSGTVTLTAAGDQTISGGGTTSFNNLTLNKTSENLILSSAATVEGRLTMNKGNISNGSNILTIGTSSSITGSITHNSGSVLGKLSRYFSNATGSKFFPVGNTNILRDVTVDFTSAPGADQYLTASYNAGYPQLSGADLYAGLPLTTADGQLIQNYDDEGYWEITPGSTATGEDYSADINSAGYDITLHMKGLTGANSASMDRTKVRIIKSEGPSHTSWVALTHGSITGSADSDYTVTASGTGFSFFGAGTEDDNALPVELVSFNGSCNDGVVDLIWQTASENNSENFEVEYSRDGIDWNLIHTEPAAGFSTEMISYTYNHKQAISGDNYYRLTQNDIDGKSITYEGMVLNLDCEADISAIKFDVYPNPNNGAFNILFQSEDNTILGSILTIVNAHGVILYEQNIEIKPGTNIYAINASLNSGMYFVKINSGTTENKTLKLTIN